MKCEIHNQIVLKATVNENSTMIRDLETQRRLHLEIIEELEGNSMDKQNQSFSKNTTSFLEL